MFETRAAAAALMVMLVACMPDVPASPNGIPNETPQRSVTEGCQSNLTPAPQQGEVYGSIFINGGRSCTTHEINLTPYPDAAARLHMPTYKSSVTATAAWRDMFEWWEPMAGAPCTAAGKTLQDYENEGSTLPEVAHSSGGVEGHCVRPGKYSFDGANRVMDVEYLQIRLQPITHSVLGELMHIETNPYQSGTTDVGWVDLIIDTDLTPGSWTDTPVLEIQLAPDQGQVYTGAFADQSNPSGSASDLFRFNAGRSTTTWPSALAGGRIQSVLGRLWLDGTNPALTTGFYSIRPEGRSVVRLLRFPNPKTPTKQYVVGLELMRPDEQPAPAPTVTRTVTITRINPDLTPSAVTAPATATLGNAMSVTIVERNLVFNEYAPVESGWTGKVYLSTDAVLSPATDRLVNTYVETSAIAANSAVNTQLQPIVPSDLASGTYYVIASLDTDPSTAVIEENESNNVRASGPITIGPAVYACAQFEGLTTWQLTDQLFTGNPVCTSQGANIRYRWRTDSNGEWTPYSTSPQYEFSGHAATGPHTVTFEVKDVSTGISATDVKTLTVQSGVVMVSGPTDITVKKNYYTYTATVSSYWWERFLPATTWQGGNGPWTSWTRTWYGGCYEVDVRAEASSGGVLKRGRLRVTVRSGTGCPPPPVL